MSRVAARYARGFDRIARRGTIRRVVANADPIVMQNVRIRLRGAEGMEISGGVDQREMVAMVLAADVPLAHRPLRNTDAIILEGARFNIRSVDDQTHRDGEELLAYVCPVVGA